MRGLGVFGFMVAVAGCADTATQGAPTPAAPDASSPDSGAVQTIYDLMDAGVEWSGPTAIFDDVTEVSGIHLTTGFIIDYFTTGQAWGDVNGDDWLDLYITSSVGPNALFLSDGDGTFTASTDDRLTLSDHQSGGAIFADYDNDGDQDLYVLALGPNILFRNEGNGRFVDVTDEAGVGDEGKGETASWGDFDGDGDLDLYVANWLCPECGPVDEPTYAQDRFYLNRGDGTFEDVSVYLGIRELRGAGFVASFVDYDNDGDADIYLVNDKGYAGEPLEGLPMNRNLLWRNDGPGCAGWCFSEVAVEAGADARVEGMGLAVGDPDLDGDLDLFFSNGLPPVFLRNLGNGRFEDASDTSGLHADQASWGTVFIDYDNDGDEDVYLAIGTGFGGPDHNRLFENTGGGQFQDVSNGSGADDSGYGLGIAAADFDRDGWVDLIVGNWNEGYVLLRNTRKAADANHYLRVRLIGTGPVNRDAVGSRVAVETPNGGTQIREIKAGSSLGAGNELVAHFGLGTAQVARVEVRWPNGKISTIGEAAADQELRLTYAD